MKNIEIARIFLKIADMLELKGENVFRIRAYRKAAQSLEAVAEELDEVAARDGLEEIPGIGKDLADKIRQYLATGAIDAYDKIKSETPPVLLDMVAIPGVGPKTAKHLFEALKISDLDDLKKKARLHKISGLPGMKAKTEENILKGLEFLKRGSGKMLLSVASEAAHEVVDRLEGLREVRKICPAGSLRRAKETVRDIDILATSKKPRKVTDSFTSMPQVKQVLAHGPTKASVVTKDDIQVDLRVMEEDEFGAALVYFTGSKEHNIRLRKLAIEKKRKVSEYGVFSMHGKAKDRERRVAGKTEKDVYSALGMPFIPPELREDTGEIEAALAGKLPKLVEMGDIKGDFHVHSQWSDGSYTLERIAQEAMKRGYRYLVITDHSKSLTIADGLSIKDRKAQTKAIKALNKKLKDFDLLAGAEVDINSDGSLDYPDDILAELDLVIAAIHSGFKDAKAKMTRRIVDAMQNKHVNMLAHPTGRLIGVRDAYEIDTEEVLRAAKATNTAVEINSYPERLDLTDINCRRAKELGVMLAVTTDSHILEHFDNMRYGLSVARRGWLEKKDLLNTYPWGKVKEKLKK
jgi:DNA polymerase (family 10)